MNGNGSREYLGFRIHDARVAVEVEKVQEVFETRLIAHVPKCPSFITGLVNVRGTIVPVIDMWLVAGADLRKMVVLKTKEGLVAMLISQLDEIKKFPDVREVQDLPERFAATARHFSGMGRDGDDYFILNSESLVAGTLARE